MKKHWSFVVTDKRYLYILAASILCGGVFASFWFRDPSFLSRSGNFIIGTGVWLGLRHTLRDGINRRKDGAASSAVLPGTNQLNPSYFNQIAFSIGDAHLQLHGFVLVLVGSTVGSFGDLILRSVCPGAFQ